MNRERLRPKEFNCHRLIETKRGPAIRAIFAAPRLLRRRFDFLCRVVNDPLLAERRVRYAVQPRTGQFSEALRHAALVPDENAQLLSEKRINVTHYILCWCVLRERLHSGRWRRERLIWWTGIARNVRRTRFLAFATATHNDASDGN